MNFFYKVLFLVLFIFLNFAKCANDGLETVKIGNQEWLTEDLKTAKYNNGDPIFEAKLPEEWEQYGKNQTGCFRILHNGTFIYNGFAIADSRGILPEGFALPEYDDFQELLENLGGVDDCGVPAEKSMAVYTYHCTQFDEKLGGLMEVEIKGNNNSAFNAKEGGFVYNHGAIGYEGPCSFWWTSTLEGTDLVSLGIGYCSNDIGGKTICEKSFGFAVRGLKKTKNTIQNQRLKLNQSVIHKSPNTESIELINSIIRITGKDFNRGTSVTGLVKGESVMAIIPKNTTVNVVVKYRYFVSSGIEEAQEEGTLQNFKITTDGPNNTKTISAEWNNLDAYAGDGTFTFRLYSEDEPQTIIAQIDSKNGSNWRHSAWIELSNDSYKKILEFISVEK